MHTRAIVDEGGWQAYVGQLLDVVAWDMGDIECPASAVCNDEEHGASTRSTRGRGALGNRRDVG